MKVAFVGQMEYDRVHFESDLDDLYEVKPFQMRWNAPPEYYQDLIMYRPDLTFVFRGELLPIPVVEQLTGIKIGMSTETMPKIIDGNLIYTHESLSRFKFFLDIFNRPFDAIFHHDESSKSFFESQGLQLSGFKPLPIATDTWQSVNTVPHRGILFIGRSTPHREQFLAPLKRDFDLLHVAHGFPGPKGATERDFLPLISNFHVALNIHTENEIAWEPRVQQLLSCGALVVSEPISPNPYLVAERDFLSVNSPEAMYRVCDEVLQNPAGFSHVNRNGLEQVQKHMNAKLTFSRLFSEIMSGVYQRAVFIPALSRIELLSVALEIPGLDHLVQRAIYRHA